MNAVNKLFPVFVVSLGILYVAIAALPPGEAEDGFHLQKFASIPVQENGRLMPFDTFARTKLMVLNRWQTVTQEIPDKAELQKRRKEQDLLDKKADGEKLDEREIAFLDEMAANRASKPIATRIVPAHEWALETMLLKIKKDNPAHDMHAFKIDNDELLALLDLHPTKQFTYYFTLSDFIDKKAFRDKVDHLRQTGGPKKGDLLDNKVMELAQKVETVRRLAAFDVPFLVPPKIGSDQKIADEKWMTIRSTADEDQAVQPDPAFLPLQEALFAYSRGNVAGFNRSLDRYLDELNKKYPDVVSRMQTELRRNNFAPDYQCMVLFIGVLILSILSWIVWHEPLRQAAWGLGMLTMVVYTFSLYLRIHLSGYAPVTNLYSSAVFIGWGAALLCLVLELILRNGIGSAVAAVTATAALIVAHNLLDGDDMAKLQAVLDSNFWLSTHVICITFGYTATFVAGFLGICYVGLGMFTPLLRREAGILLGKVVYGVVCFALFLSFVGTVLGGIWADQSWGRFWGWDPKENGALLIVIWNAIILHARWGGMVKTRGVAMLAIFGNVVTAWSWFGTNLLGVGLHAYGGGEGGPKAGMIRLFVFALSQLAIIALAAVPMRHWESFRPESTRRVVI